MYDTGAGRAQCEKLDSVLKPSTNCPVNYNVV